VPIVSTRSGLRLYSPSPHVGELARSLECSPFLASLMEMMEPSISNRPEQAREWLNPSLNSMLDTVDIGVDSHFKSSFWSQIDDSKNIAVYGDYDVDGVCSTVLAMELVMAKGGKTRYFIPHRHEQGYGLHEEVIDLILEGGADGIIVVDCGSKDQITIKGILDRGKDLMVYDHHLPDNDSGVVPSWLVNPQLQGDHQSRTLCATAVLWVWAYQNRIMPHEWMYSKLDLVALATLADCMPLGLLNRSMVMEGMKSIKHNPRPGLLELIDLLGIPRTMIDEEKLVMKVIPCLNAPGRMDVADGAVNLLAGSGNSRINAQRIISINRKRQETSKMTFQELNKHRNIKDTRVFYCPDWHIGVLSGVASNLCSSTNEPIILAAPVNGKIRGTLRVPKGANAVKILDDISPYLDEWGGHEHAAGFAVETERWVELFPLLESRLSRVETEPPLITAMAIPAHEMNIRLYNEIILLSPFGNGNPRPLFYHEWKGTEKVRPLGKDGLHRKISIKDVDILAFNSVDHLSAIREPEGLVYYPRLDTWRGKTRLQLILEAIIVEK